MKKLLAIILAVALSGCSTLKLGPSTQPGVFIATATLLENSSAAERPKREAALRTVSTGLARLAATGTFTRADVLALMPLVSDDPKIRMYGVFLLTFFPESLDARAYSEAARNIALGINAALPPVPAK